MKKHNLLGLFKSKGRLSKEPTSKYRSPFQRDRDRIIHSASFRRLKHKTQVFVNTEGDHFRTRITHSIEVAQIARSVAKYLNLNEDLAETLSLAHDLGHTPFGHAGEDALDECMENHGGFDHNLQTLRIVMFLENKYFKFKGLNLSIETLEGLLKHNGPIEDRDLVNNLIGLKTFKDKINFDTYPSLEAQISAISDDIAYNSHDLEDGLKANLFDIEDLMQIPILSDVIKNHKKKTKKNNKELVLRQIVREIINEMVKDIIENTKKNIKHNKLKSLKNVLSTSSTIVCFSPNMNLFDLSIKEFLREKMYYSKDVLKKTNQGKKIIKFLFLQIMKNPKKFINLHNQNKENIERCVCDFIAGMTDRYAINLYKKIK